MARRFHLERDVDETGISGTGRIAEGVQFSSGWCSMIWLTQYFSVVVYPDVESVVLIHGHGGKTRLVWDDEEHA
jgi:hypothetical protein